MTESTCTKYETNL